MHSENAELAFVRAKEIVVMARHQYKWTKMFWCMYFLSKMSKY